MFPLKLFLNFSSLLIFFCTVPKTIFQITGCSASVNGEPVFEIPGSVPLQLEDLSEVPQLCDRLV